MPAATSPQEIQNTNALAIMPNASQRSDRDRRGLQLSTLALISRLVAFPEDYREKARASLSDKYLTSQNLRHEWTSLSHEAQTFVCLHLSRSPRIPVPWRYVVRALAVADPYLPGAASAVFIRGTSSRVLRRLMRAYTQAEGEPRAAIVDALRLACVGGAGEKGVKIILQLAQSGTLADDFQSALVEALAYGMRDCGRRTRAYQDAISLARNIMTDEKWSCAAKKEVKWITALAVHPELEATLRSAGLHVE